MQGRIVWIQAMAPTILEFVDKLSPDDGMLVKGEDSVGPRDDPGCMPEKPPPKLQGTEVLWGGGAGAMNEPPREPGPGM